jgi:hypothetical protein
MGDDFHSAVEEKNNIQVLRSLPIHQNQRRAYQDYDCTRYYVHCTELMTGKSDLSDFDMKNNRPYFQYGYL